MMMRCRQRHVWRPLPCFPLRFCIHRVGRIPDLTWRCVCGWEGVFSCCCGCRCAACVVCVIVHVLYVSLCMCCHAITPTLYTTHMFPQATWISFSNHPHPPSFPLITQVFNINSNDVCLTLTSGGCNALNLLIHGAKQVVSVDCNPAQSALLQLKQVAIQQVHIQ